MSKMIKELIVKEITRKQKDVTNWMAVNYRGIPTMGINSLRRHLTASGVKMNVLKNTSARIAFKGLKLEEAGKIIDGPTALIYSESKGQSDDPVSLSKALFAWREKNPDTAKLLQIRGGYAEGRFVTGEQVAQFSKMPSREMLLSMLAGAFSAPMSRLAFVLNNLPQKTVYALKALLDKKPADAPAAQAPAKEAPAPSQN